MNKLDKIKQNFAKTILDPEGPEYKKYGNLVATTILASFVSAFLIPTGDLIQTQPDDTGADNRVKVLNSFDISANALIASHNELNNRLAQDELEKINALANPALDYFEKQYLKNDVAKDKENIKSFYNLLARDIALTENDKMKLLDRMGNATDTKIEVNPAYLDECRISDPTNVYACTTEQSDYSYQGGVLFNLLVLASSLGYIANDKKLKRWAKGKPKY